MGTPIYRGTYTGALKNLVGVLPNKPMRGKVVGLVGAGGSLDHALARDHTRRPRFAFVPALTAPEGVAVTPVESPPNGSWAPTVRVVDRTLRLTPATRRGT